MKKNVMMRVASVLLIAVMMTTCAISGTFAKYVSSGFAEDTARVAKWGVTVEADGTSTFGKFYFNKLNGNTLNSSYTFGTDSVASSDSDKVVAPGTKGTAAGLTITGVPEVDTKVTFTADVTLTGWTTNGADYYCPLVFTVTTNNNGVVVTTPIYGTVYADAAAFENAIELEVQKALALFPANTAINDDALTVAWEWPFEGNDAKDTLLGNRAADGNAAKVTVEVTATVTQED